jgi:hypothetical protein
VDEWGYVGEFLVDNRRCTGENAHAMIDVRRLVGLAEASEHLWRAREDLVTAGYGDWVPRVAELLNAIALEIRWLSTEEKDSNPVA